MKMSDSARKRWDQIPAEVRVKLLNNVWCANCREMRGIGNAEGSLKDGDLVLKGVCTRCGCEVARLIEGS